MKRLSLVAFVAVMALALSGISSYAGVGVSLSVTNVTVPPGLKNIEYIGSPIQWGKGCPFDFGGSAFLNDGDQVSCTAMAPGTYGIIEANGPFTAELSCNLRDTASP